MNRFSLRSDSHTWWLPAGIAGVFATGALAASLMTSPSATPDQVVPPASGVEPPAGDVQRGYAHIPADRCSPPPDPAYVGQPWVAHDSECDTLRHWWKYVH